MAYTHNNKRAVETFLVAAAGQTALPNADTALVNASTGAVNLNNGQLGFFAAYPLDAGSGVRSLNTALNHTTTYDTIANAPWVQIFQGNENSADPSSASANYPLWVRPYEASSVIKGSNNLTVTKKEPVAPTTSTWAIGQPAGTGSGEITALDNTEYSISIAYRGRRMDEFYHPEGTNHFSPSFVTPNYTALGTAQPVDHLIQNLAWEINRNSKAVAVNRTKFRGNDPVVALAIDASSPSAGTEIGEGGSGGTAIAAGDFIPVVNTSFGVKGITLTADQADSIKDAVVAATGVAIGSLDANILTIDLATAGTATGGTADMIILLALDADLAFDDKIPQVKTRLDVGLTRGFDFNTVYATQEVNASEGQGQGRTLDLWYKATHGQRKYNLDHTHDPIPEFPSPIDTADAYYQYTVMHEDENQVDVGNVVVSPKKAIVLVPDANTTLVTAIDNVFGAWVASANGVGIVEA
jgi:hypothetical protein